MAIEYCLKCGNPKSEHSPVNGCCWANAGMTQWTPEPPAQIINIQQSFNNGFLAGLGDLGAGLNRPVEVLRVIERHEAEHNQPILKTELTASPVFNHSIGNEALRQEVLADMRMYPEVKELMHRLLPEEFFGRTFPEMAA